MCSQLIKCFRQDACVHQTSESHLRHEHSICSCASKASPGGGSSSLRCLHHLLPRLTHRPFSFLDPPRLSSLHPVDKMAQRGFSGSKIFLYFPTVSNRFQSSSGAEGDTSIPQLRILSDPHRFPAIGLSPLIAPPFRSSLPLTSALYPSVSLCTSVFRLSLLFSRLPPLNVPIRFPPLLPQLLHSFLPLSTNSSPCFYGTQ